MVDCPDGVVSATIRNADCPVMTVPLGRTSLKGGALAALQSPMPEAPGYLGDGHHSLCRLQVLK
jgi:hypothetical protein